MATDCFQDLKIPSRWLSHGRRRKTEEKQLEALNYQLHVWLAGLYKLRNDEYESLQRRRVTLLKTLPLFSFSCSRNWFSDCTQSQRLLGCYGLMGLEITLKTHKDNDKQLANHWWISEHKMDFKEHDSVEKLRVLQCGNGLKVHAKQQRAQCARSTDAILIQGWDINYKLK